MSEDEKTNEVTRETISPIDPMDPRVIHAQIDGADAETLRGMLRRALGAVERLSALLGEKIAIDNARAQGAEVYELVDAIDRSGKLIAIPPELGTVVGTLDRVLVIVLPDDVPDDCGEQIASFLEETSGSHGFGHVLIFPRAVRALRIARRS